MKLDFKAKHYAEALFTVAGKSNAEKEVKDSLNLLNNILKKSSAFRAFMLSKRISNDDKAKVVQKSFGGGCNPILLEFISLVDEENFVKLFKLLEKFYELKFANSMNIVEITAHVSKEFSDDDRSKLKESLGSILDKTIDLNVNVDPTLIGGIKLRVDNKFLDASIQNHLENMRQTLLDA